MKKFLFCAITSSVVCTGDERQTVKAIKLTKVDLDEDLDDSDEIELAQAKVDAEVSVNADLEVEAQTEASTEHGDELYNATTGMGGTAGRIGRGIAHVLFPDMCFGGCGHANGGQS